MSVFTTCREMLFNAAISSPAASGFKNRKWFLSLTSSWNQYSTPMLMGVRLVPCTSLGIIVIAVLLYLQPDASQLLAFSLPVIVLLLKSNISKIIKAGSSAILFLLTLKSWFCLDTLQPVNYTEGVLTMLRDLSAVLYFMGIAALFWVPVHFLISSTRKNMELFRFRQVQNCLRAVVLLFP